MKKYVIVPTGELTQDMVDASDQSSLNTVRKSLDQTETVLSFEGDTPWPLVNYRVLSWEETLQIMQSNAWSASMNSTGYALWDSIKGLFGF